MRELQEAGDKTELYVRAGPQTAASWRTTVRLSPGRYQFMGTVRAAGVQPLPFGKRHGVTLHVWRPHPKGSEPASFNTTGQTLQVEFELTSEQEAELRCELRARAGEAWFDLSSLRLIRISPR
jgi:hypothetical protein